MLDNYLRDAGSMNPLAVGEPIVGLIWSAGRTSVVSPPAEKRRPLRAERVVEFKSGSWPAVISSLLRKAL